MSYLSVKEILQNVLSGAVSPADMLKKANPEDINDIKYLLKSIFQKANTTEKLNLSEHGQWNLEKAIKPGPSLNYGTINPEANPISNPKAAADAKKQRYADIETNAPKIDWKSDRMSTPKYYAGAADKAKQVRAEIDRQANESAVDTMARRQKLKQSDTSDMMMSEKEPHMEDPKHEEKEKKKAKKIKSEAEDLLDMHKAERFNANASLSPKESAKIKSKVDKIKADRAKQVVAPRKPGTEPPAADAGYDDAVKPSSEKAQITRKKNNQENEPNIPKTAAQLKAMRP